MRVALFVVHYGAEYLAWAIRSVQDAVDQIHIVYSDRPSFSYDTKVACPDTEEVLKKEAHRFLTKPLFWHRGRWPAEGAHRDAAMSIVAAAGAKQVVVVDSDELWDAETLSKQFLNAGTRPERNMLVPFVHFWRSFGWVCSDPSRPVRIINIGRTGDWYLDPQAIPVLHFGYAQSEAITRYKIAIHGHRAEWRPGWLTEKFLSWTPGSPMKDVHPTCGWNTSFNDYFWNPRPADAMIKEVVGKLLYDHPYRDLGIIR